jgi:hypothetical protein
MQSIHSCDAYGFKMHVLVLQALALPKFYDANGSCTIPEMAFGKHMPPKPDPAVRSFELVFRITPCHERVLRAPCDA